MEADVTDIQLQFLVFQAHITSGPKALLSIKLFTNNFIS